MLPSVENRTPFPHMCPLVLNDESQLVLLLVLSATYKFDQSGNMAAVSEQLPVCVADQHVGAPGKSTLLDEAAIAPRKGLVDIVLNATAYAPGGKPAKEVSVGFRVGALTKSLLISGDRSWGGLLNNRPSTPRPFVTMPLIYERAYGGSHFAGDPPEMKACLQENPIGIGYRGALSASPLVQSEVPNIELPLSRITSTGDRIEVAGFSAVARHWTPRVRYAGTYDQAWQDKQWPFPPKDLNPLFHQFAPADQQWNGPITEQEVVLTNLTPEGSCRFKIPSFDLPVQILTLTKHEERWLRPDTLFIEPDERRVRLISRLLIQDLRRAPVQEIVIGAASYGWIRARLTGKPYWRVGDSI